MFILQLQRRQSYTKILIYKNFSKKNGKKTLTAASYAFSTAVNAI